MRRRSGEATGENVHELELRTVLRSTRTIGINFNQGHLASIGSGSVAIIFNSRITSGLE